MHRLVLFVWGDVKAADEMVDRSIAQLKSMLSKEELNTTTTLSYNLLYALYLLGRDAEAVALMQKLSLHWDVVSQTIETWKEAEAAVLLGETDAHMLRTLDVMWCLRSFWLLIVSAGSNEGGVAQSDAGNYDELAAQLPSAAQMANFGTLQDGHAAAGCHIGHACAFTSVVWAALGHERLGRPDDALACVACVVDPNPRTGGDPHPFFWSIAFRCQGRILARAAAAAEAESAFEEAATIAHSNGYACLEAMAVRELIEFVLEPSGRAPHGRQRLRELMQQLSLSNSELDTLCTLK